VGVNAVCICMLWQVRLDASQSAAVTELEERLKAESDVLSTLQQKAMQQLEVNNRNEYSELEQKIEIRRTVLDERVRFLSISSS